MEEVEREVLAGVTPAAVRHHHAGSETPPRGRTPGLQHLLAEPHRGRGRRHGVTPSLPRRRPPRGRTNAVSRAETHAGTVHVAGVRSGESRVSRIRGDSGGAAEIVSGDDVRPAGGGGACGASGVGDALPAAPAGHGRVLRVRAGEGGGDSARGEGGGRRREGEDGRE